MGAGLSQYKYPASEGNLWGRDPCVTELAGPMVWCLPDQAVQRVLEDSVVGLALDDC